MRREQRDRHIAKQGGREQGMEAGTTGQSTTEAARTTRRSTLTIAQLRVGGALAHTLQWHECLQESPSRSYRVRGIGGMWSESRGGLREDRATFPSPRRPVVA
eukprot:2111632-Prymnesium_polylepis.1